MRSYLKIKALAQIFLLISLTFFIGSFTAEPATAQENIVPCCKVATNGQSCVANAPKDQCQLGQDSQTSCSTTSGCNIKGCCIVNDNQCHKETTKQSCTQQGGTFQEGSCDLIDVCKPTCCVQGNQCGITTQAACSANNGEVRSDIQNEQACVALCATEQQGCCADTCSYGLRSSCSQENFYPGVQCTNVLANQCKNKCSGPTTQQCGDDGAIYERDSCGNQLRQVDACNPNGLNNKPTTACIADAKGKASCQPLDCATTWDNPAVDGDGGPRKNNEAWCEYQAATGPTLDLPGTKHYLHYCERGVEKVDSGSASAELRNKICIYGSPQLNGQILPSIAKWVDNNWGDCLKTTNQVDCESTDQTCVWLANTQAESFKQDGTTIAVKLPVYYNPDDEEIMIKDETFDIGPTEDIEFQITGPVTKTERFTNGQTLPGELGEDGWKQYTFTFTATQGNYHIFVHNNKKDEDDVDIYKGDISPATIKEKTQDKGRCVPLVPPEDASQCFLVPLTTEEVIRWEKNVRVVGDWECDPEEPTCDYYRKEDFKIKTNSICTAYGTCGAKYNLLGVFSNAGYRRNCDPNGKDYEDLDTECKPEENTISTPLPFDRYKNAGKGLNFFDVDLSKVLSPEAYQQLETSNVGPASGWVSAVSAAGTAIAIYKFAALTAAVGGPLGWGIALGLALIATVSLIIWVANEDQLRDIGAQCTQWQPPSGSESCSKCTELLPDQFSSAKDGNLPSYTCTKSLCMSLGECQHVPDTPDGPQCIPIDRQDILHSTLRVVENELHYDCGTGTCTKTIQDDKLLIDGKLKEYSPFNVTLTSINPATSQPELAHCRYATGIEHRDDTYDAMKPMEEGDTASISHKLHIANTGEDKTWNIYIKCKDESPRHNEMPVPFLIQFSTAKQPDKNPPTIQRFHPQENNAYTRSGATTLDVTLEVNDNLPSGLSLTGGCRWSNTTNIHYENMQNYLTCTPGGIAQLPACTATINDLTKKETTIYFRCKDNDGNANTQDIPYTIKQSDSLTITDTRCTTLLGNECTTPLYGKELNITLTTSGGIDNGIATCSYKLNTFSTIEMLETSAHTHKQNGIPLAIGPHILLLSCTDTIGNNANKTLSFTAEQDTIAPRIINGYVSDNLLTLQTSEISSCTTLATNEQQALAITGTTLHSTPLNDQDRFLITCTDRFQNVGTPTKITIL